MTPPLHQSSVYYASTTATAEFNQNNGAARFDRYLPPEVVEIGIQNGTIISGVLRINPRNYEDAFISAPAGLSDIYICGMKDRNRALAGDLVCVLIEPSHRWRIVGQKNLDPARVERLRSCLGPKSSSHQPQKPILNSLSYRKVESTETKLALGKEHPVVINGVHVATLPRDQASVSSEIQVVETLVTDDKNAQETKSKKRRKRRKKKKSEAESNLDADDEEEVGDSNLQKNSAGNNENASPVTIDPVSSNSSSSPNPTSEKEDLIVDDAIPPPGSLRSWSDLTKYPQLKHLIQMTGKVVFIKEQNHPRVAGGHLSLLKDKNPSYALFSPLDSRVPRMMIPMQQCPSDFYHFPERYQEHLFMASLDSWDEARSFPLGRLQCCIGRSGEVEAESRLILFEKCIDTSEFTPEAYEGLPIDPKDTEGKTWVIPEEERTYRRDFTHECVFTIDPSTARDLDDALSIKKLDDGTFEVGVHIADVSYFVREGLPLDYIARRRTTSCYLVQKVIPMLPRILCEKLCSLNAGEEKLTFSVVWKMNENAEILDSWFGRSIINSCVKLSYEMAQDIIDDPDRQWTADDLPPIFGAWKPADIVKSIHMLQSLAVPMRRRRFDNGALLIDKMKIGFVLDQKTGLPIGFSPYKMRPANHLVEEYMLLANISVAQRIYQFYPALAFLRRHPEPDSKQLAEFELFCKKNNLGDSIDIATSGSLHETMTNLRSKDPLMAAAVSHYLLKSMAQAVYFCAGSCKESFRHYALSVDLYTHFTSPIRRYPDVIVHRMLAATLNQSVPGEGVKGPVRDGINELDNLAHRCNEMKKNAREASEASSNLFLKLYYRAVGPIEEEAVVTKIMDNSLEIVLLRSAFCNRISLADHKQLMIRFEATNLQERGTESSAGAPSMKIYWKRTEKGQDVSSGVDDAIVQTISPCDRIKVQVQVDPSNLHKMNTFLIHPEGHTILADKVEDWSVPDLMLDAGEKPKSNSQPSKKEKSKKKKAKQMQKLVEKFSQNLAIDGSSVFD